LLSSPYSLDLPPLAVGNSHYSFNAVFSPNGRFVYLTDQSGKQLIQYDLEAANINTSRTLVAEWDGFIDPSYNIGTRFGHLQHAPDGKIYVWSAGTL
jgi:sugar lactone lactonase YvrE